jgi:hypothetical protein
MKEQLIGWRNNIYYSTAASRRLKNDGLLLALFCRPLPKPTTYIASHIQVGNSLTSPVLNPPPVSDFSVRRYKTQIRINRQRTQSNGRARSSKKQSHKALVSRRSTPAQITRRTKPRPIDKHYETIRTCKAFLMSWGWPPKHRQLIFQILC